MDNILIGGEFPLHSPQKTNISINYYSVQVSQSVPALSGILNLLTSYFAAKLNVSLEIIRFFRPFLNIILLSY